LPWSTSNDDLIELFTTIGKVERAEIQYESNGRSKGTGVVEFASQDDAATSIGMSNLWFPLNDYRLILLSQPSSLATSTAVVL